MFFKHMKLVFQKTANRDYKTERPGRQKGVFSSLDAFFQEEFERDVAPGISPTRTLDFVFAH